jgi:hypothetical protein
MLVLETVSTRINISQSIGNISSISGGGGGGGGNSSSSSSRRP